ncbi:MAG: diacylglycerol kinase family lipid kinase [Bacteroidales bacterium]|nr:diacylglycerol kinase family lipid kinase [Bacteroidales bacterium]
MKNICFIINPHSGTGKYKHVEYMLQKYLDKTKYNYTIYYTKYRGHAEEIIKQVLQEQQVDVVAAVGGDGTINEVARTLINTNVAMAMVPTGSGNGLARHLKIPNSISKTIEVINKMHIEAIDTLDVNGHPCISIAGTGFDAVIAEKFDETQTRGFWSYLKFIIKTYFVYKSHTYIIESPEFPSIKKKALLVSIANSSQWGFNVKISPHASIQDGKVDICMLQKSKFFTLLGDIFLLLIGQIEKNKLVIKICSASECTIRDQDNDSQYCHIDGDPIARQKEIKIKVNPESLKVVIPTFI